MFRLICAVVVSQIIAMQAFALPSAKENDPGYRYGLCLGNALEKRMAEKPLPTLARGVEKAVFDCQHMELEYLGINPKQLDRETLQKRLALHRVETQQNMIDLQIKLVGDKAISIAWLRLLDETCPNINQATLQRYLSQSKDAILKADPYFTDDAILEDLIKTASREKIHPRLQKKGVNAWCVESKQIFGGAGADNLFTK